MEEYTYINIFATKGIEYLIVIAYFITFVFFTRALDTPSKHNRKKAGRDSHVD